MQTPMSRRHFGALVLGSGLAVGLACAPGSRSRAPAPEGTLVHTVTYVAGPGWKEGEPISAQGLDPHFAFMGDKLGSGTLIANGPYGDAIEGLYVFAVDDRAGVDAIVATDPAVASGTLTPSSIAPWFIVMDGLDAPRREGESLFVLEYGPGPKWKTGKPMMEQKLGPHLKYVSGLFKGGRIIVGGPIPDANRGRYIVSATDRDGAQQLVDADPGVARGLFQVELRPWMAVQRQSVGTALALARSSRSG